MALIRDKVLELHAFRDTTLGFLSHSGLRVSRRGQSDFRTRPALAVSRHLVWTADIGPVLEPVLFGELHELLIPCLTVIVPSFELVCGLFHQSRPNHSTIRSRSVATVFKPSTDTRTMKANRHTEPRVTTHKLCPTRLTVRTVKQNVTQYRAY